MADEGKTYRFIMKQLVCAGGRTESHFGYRVYLLT
jgi:hypothetical protein